MRTLAQTKAAVWLVCLNRAGYLNGARLVEFIDDWRDCVIANDGPVSMNHYADWTRRFSRRTAYERLAMFRKAFPELGESGNPEGLLGPLLDRLAREIES